MCQVRVVRMRRVFDTGADVEHEVPLGKWRRCIEDEPAARRAVGLGTKALGDDRRPAVAADRAAPAGLFDQLMWRYSGGARSPPA